MSKTIRDELSKIIHPRAVKKVRLENKVIGTTVVHSIFTFLMGYFAIFIVSLLIVSLDNFDFSTNFSAVVATINNIGPGIGKVGPYGNFSEFSDLSKIVFCFKVYFKSHFNFLRLFQNLSDLDQT
jgi:trk system potassium uptake protein TrkH